MRRLALVAIASFSPCLAPAATPTAEELLAAMDEVLQFDTRTSTATMEVIDARRIRPYRMKSYPRGQDDAAVLYLEPAREKGTKLLRKDDNLWLYMPRAERVQKISGHMLRQGMMGSDMSYEDMLEAADFEERYEAEVVGEDETAGRPCWKLEARARDDSVSYPAASCGALDPHQANGVVCLDGRRGDFQGASRRIWSSADPPAAFLHDSWGGERRSESSRGRRRRSHPARADAEYTGRRRQVRWPPRSSPESPWTQLLHSENR